MKISCVLALVPLLCGLALAQDSVPLSPDELNTLFETTPSPTTAPPRGVRCPFVDIRSQWLKSAYAEGGCLANRDFTVYTCCNETDERVKVNGKYECQPPSSLKVVARAKFSTPEGFPGDECPKEFLDDFPAGYREDSFSTDPSELCSGSCFSATGELKPPYHYYEFVDCCQGWTKLKTDDGKYLCRCDGSLYQAYGSSQLQCRPSTG